MQTLEKKPSKTKTLEEKTRELEKLANTLTEEQIDEALEKVLSAIQLLSEINEVKLKLHKKIQNTKQTREIFTLEELKELDTLQRALTELEVKTSEFSYSIDRLRLAISSLIPKVKENFKVRIGKFIIELKGEEITRIERI